MGDISGVVVGAAAGAAVLFVVVIVVVAVGGDSVVVLLLDITELYPGYFSNGCTDEISFFSASIARIRSNFNFSSSAFFFLTISFITFVVGG